VLTHGDEVPRGNTCEGEDVSPALSCSDPFDAEVEVGFRTERGGLERALAGHVLVTAELLGT
jgi:hypothetical protein